MSKQKQNKTADQPFCVMNFGWKVSKIYLSLSFSQNEHEEVLVVGISVLLTGFSIRIDLVSKSKSTSNLIS